MQFAQKLHSIEEMEANRIEFYRRFEEDATDGYYSFIGSSKEKELNQLNNDYLAGVIQGINQYDGQFQQSCHWDLDIEYIKRVLDNR